TKAAAGVAGLIKIAMALKYKVLPPTIKIDKPLEILNPGAAPVYVNTYARPWLSRSHHPRRAALSAFGFGGSNFHCVVEEADPLSHEADWDGNVLIYSFSDKSRSELVTKLKSIKVAQKWESLRYQAAASLAGFKQTDNCRLVLVITRETDLNALIHDVCIKLEDKQGKSWSLANSAYFGEGKPAGKLAILFPGQGSQYTDMQLDLACQFPEVQNSIANASQIFESAYPEKSLGNLIFPIPVFTDEEKRNNTDKLRQTQHAQPAIGAASIGLFNALTAFGIQPDMTAGHSFGELTALCAAGVVDETSLIKLAIKRGELMITHDSEDRGSMLAVSASAAVVHEILEAEQLDLIIANNNAPRQVVLSGATEQIDRAIEVLG
ncbi:MAG: acyltransferase domain-containing protein, partial [Gammaproteobacteria bacterium]|nr:acyltransferase domain-containing protein [Gammaproteobacteria bacterium]